MWYSIAILERIRTVEVRLILVTNLNLESTIYRWTVVWMHRLISINLRFQAFVFVMVNSNASLTGKWDFLPKCGRLISNRWLDELNTWPN